MKQRRGDWGNMMTKYNVAFWNETWKRKKTSVLKLAKCK